MAAKHKVEGEAVLQLKNFDDCRPVMSEDITEEAVVLFVSSKSLPPRGRVHPGHSSPLSTRPSARELMTSVGQEGKLGEVEDNEEPDSDEEVRQELEVNAHIFVKIRTVSKNPR